jgi:hypothetical protein
MTEALAPNPCYAALRLDVFQANALATTKCRPSLRDLRQECRIALEPVFEPIILRLESNEDASRLAVARDDNLFLRRDPEVAREVVLNLSDRYPRRLLCLRPRATRTLRLCR